MGPNAPNLQGDVYSSHATVRGFKGTKILYYQKMICDFQAPNGKGKRCECIVYCQMVERKPVGFGKMIQNIKEGEYGLVNTAYYLLFALTMFCFFFGGRYCERYKIRREEINEEFKDNATELEERL